MSLYFSKSHEWAKVDGNKVKVGISDYAQSELGDIVYVGLPELGTILLAGDALCDVESVKAVSEIFSPVGGKVVAVNEELEDAPELINTDAMNAWICEIELSELPKLMSQA
ncbi:MAG: glycine cleavage system protein GcvH, partial [Clostridia bacterium]